MSNQDAQGSGIAQADHGSTAIVNQFTLAGGQIPAPPPMQPPAPPQPFVGRVQMRGELIDALRREPGGVQTLAGLGGVGKTALAARVAHDLYLCADNPFCGGILWLALQTVPAVDTLWAQIAAAYGYPPAADPAPLARAALNQHRPLLIIDNAEAAPGVARALLDGRGAATALLTSRDRGVSVGFAPPRALGPLERRAAMELLRARSGVRGDEAAVEAICDLLGDLPLAIELAAGYIATYDEPPAGYLALLRQSSLGETLHLDARRDTSILVAFGLSRDRLSEDARLALTVLALDGGESCALTAVAAGAGWHSAPPDDAPPDGPDMTELGDLPAELAGVLRELLGELARPSAPPPDTGRARHAVLELLRRSLAERAGARNGALRCRLHPLVRRYAVERGADGERGAIRARLEGHYLAYAETYARPRESSTRAGYDALEAERSNILAAMDWAARGERWARVRRFAWALDSYLDTRGYWGEYRRCLEQALRAARAGGEERESAAFAYNLGNLAYSTGERDEARRLYGQSLEMAEALGDRAGVAKTLHQLGRLAQDTGDLDEARRLYGQSLEMKEALGNRAGVATTLGQLGMLAYSTGDRDEARRLYGQSLEMAEALGNRAGVAQALHQLGNLAYSTGELDEARRLYGQALDVFRELGNRRDEASVLHQLANLADDEGDHGEAERLYRRALALAGEVGDVVSAGIHMFNLALLCEAQGRLAEALPLLERAVEIAERVGLPQAKGRRRVLARVRGKLGAGAS